MKHVIYTYVIETNWWATKTNGVSKTRSQPKCFASGVARWSLPTGVERTLGGCSSWLRKQGRREPWPVLANLNRLRLKVSQPDYFLCGEVFDLPPPPYHKIDHVYHLMNHISNIFPVIMNFLTLARCFLVKNASACNWPHPPSKTVPRLNRQGYKRQERKGKGGNRHDDRSVVLDF